MGAPLLFLLFLSQSYGYATANGSLSLCLFILTLFSCFCVCVCVCVNLAAMLQGLLPGPGLRAVAEGLLSSLFGLSVVAALTSCQRLSLIVCEFDERKIERRREKKCNYSSREETECSAHIDNHRLMWHSSIATATREKPPSAGKNSIGKEMVEREHSLCSSVPAPFQRSPRAVRPVYSLFFPINLHSCDVIFPFYETIINRGAKW